MKEVELKALSPKLVTVLGIVTLVIYFSWKTPFPILVIVIQLYVSGITATFGQVVYVVLQYAMSSLPENVKHASPESCFTQYGLDRIHVCDVPGTKDVKL